jgi:hypothetical protein
MAFAELRASRIFAMRMLKVHNDGGYGAVKAGPYRVPNPV